MLLLGHYQTGPICSRWVLHVPVSLSDWYNMFFNCSCVTIRLVQLMFFMLFLCHYQIGTICSSCCSCVIIRLVQYVFSGFPVLLLCHYLFGRIYFGWVIRTTAASLSNWSNMFSVGSPYYCLVTIKLVQYILGGFSVPRHYQIGPICSWWILWTTSVTLSSWSSLVIDGLSVLLLDWSNMCYC